MAAAQPAKIGMCPVLSGGHLLRPTAVTDTKEVDGVQYINIAKHNDVLCHFLFRRRACVRPWASLELPRTLRALRNVASASVPVEQEEEEAADDGVLDLGLDDVAPPPKRLKASASVAMGSPITICHNEWSLKVLSGRGYTDVYMELTEENMNLLFNVVKCELAQAPEASAESKKEAFAVSPPSPGSPLPDGDPETPTKASLRGMTWLASQRRWIVRYGPSGKSKQKTFSAQGDGDDEATKREAEEQAQVWINLNLRGGRR